MKRPHLAAALLAATLLVGACGSTDSDTSSAAPTTTATSTPSAAPTSASSSPTNTPEESAAAAASSATAGEPYSFPGYRQACLEAITMLDQFDQLNKSWDPNSAELDRTSAVEELLAEVKTGAEFQAMSASEQDQFTKAFRSAATGRC
ncbi:hypothetical protein GS907_24700 [Rhodococcus hoagii]|nr:hypothetical protein [Prescottella equi]